MRKRDGVDWTSEMFDHASPFFWMSKRSLELRHLPFLLVHGQMDNLVPFPEVLKFHELLVQRGCNVALVNLLLAHHGFDMVHGLRAAAVNMYVTRWIWAIHEGHV